MTGLLSLSVSVTSETSVLPTVSDDGHGDANLNRTWPGPGLGPGPGRTRKMSSASHGSIFYAVLDVLPPPNCMDCQHQLPRK